MGDLKKFAPIVVRLGISLVFLWFGLQQLMNATPWTGLIPDFIVSLSGMSALMIVYINGVFEIIFGICLLLGFFTRIVALLLALHLVSITLAVGYNGVGVRDFGLSMATISVFLTGIDTWCLDSFLMRRKISAS